MQVSTLFQQDKPTFSFEFFPPKSPKASEALFQTIQEIIPLSPAYVSITYGAGGSTRDLTHDLVLRLRNETRLTVVSHLTCVDSARGEISAILDRYHRSGIENIMALRGDPPEGQKEFRKMTNGFAYAAELVAFIRQEYPQICIGVAGYPEGHVESPNRLKEMDYLKAKVDAGADYICTQLFFDNRDFYDFRERCVLAGINVPIVAGIMPITSMKTMQRMADLARGARYPARLLKALSRAENDTDVERVGTHWATEQVLDLLDRGVDGVHFYTLNRSKTTLSIYKTLCLAC
ncbi:MAG: methylenetetrahydrofolate reductase [NAD(P)H] [Anaerolineaceae bacterium]|nr:methylenetetrahydrofolate reductase [NAD(P)H] [Anaerolineaceae bacterium]